MIWSGHVANTDEETTGLWTGKLKDRNHSVDVGKDKNNNAIMDLQNTGWEFVNCSLFIWHGTMTSGEHSDELALS